MIKRYHHNASLQKPLLVFDADCLFCRWWVYRWHCHTGRQVEYTPFQEVQSQYPSIPTAQFERAVHLMLPDGSYLLGAEAVLYVLKLAGRYRWWYWSYAHIPGVRWLCEKTYQHIARHRSFFAKITVFIFGQDPTPRFLRNNT
ncbi:MAG: DUF393 domain-containing protein [Candidatus Andersenbacteria bacterium]